jgi:GNAT superfamily N-acetyltransferase
MFMTLTFRKATIEDATQLGTICYEAFKNIADEHNFPTDFASPDQAIGLMTMLLSRPDAYNIAAEIDGKLVASNFLWEGNSVSGVGPITVDPEVQNSSIGRKLMEDVMRRSDEQGFLSCRLVQSAYHNRSLSLYTKLGFNAVEPLSVIQGPALNLAIEGYAVRKMTNDDVDAVDALCCQIQGLTRHQEVLDGIAAGGAFVVEHDGRLTGYTTTLGFFGHSVGESNEDLKALIGAVPVFPGAGFLLPTRNSELLRWCLGRGLRIVQPLTLMSRGVYQDPRGAFLCSILY